MFMDITGRRFGKLIAQYRIKRNGGSYWHCVCDCGNEKDIYLSQLTTGKVTSCGCDRPKRCGNAERLLNKKFNMLTVIAFDHYSKTHKDYWKCKCDCGNETIVQGYNLTSGAVRSCGCLHKKAVYDNWFIDLTGQRYGMLTVLKFIGRKNLQSLWLCKCDCGREVIVNTNNLRKGHTRSCGNHRTHEENIVRDYVESLGVTTYKDRQHLGGLEIDMYIPEYNIGVEYNGSAFHATENGVFRNLDKYYHRDKFLKAKQKGIHLISIFDVDWYTKQDKIKAYLKDLLTQKQKVYARKCVVKCVDKNIANDFCDKYHLQNHTNLSSICYGLYYNNELLSVMTFGKLRLKKQQDNYYELHRYCVKSGYTVIGGAKKLFNTFIKEYKPQHILSYSDNDYFSGSIYPMLGFKYIKQAEPNYYWFKTLDEWYKREQCQVQKLKKNYPQYYQEAIDNNATNIEEYIMINCFSCKKVYRSGNVRWELVL